MTFSMEDGWSLTLKKKPKFLGKKRYYKKLYLFQKEQIRQKDKKYHELEERYCQLQGHVCEMVNQYGQHFHIETHGDLQIGDNDVHLVSDNTEIIDKLETLLTRTTNGFMEAVTARAESTLMTEALRETLALMATKLFVIETESTATQTHVGGISKQSSDIISKLDDLKELATLAQNPEPTLENVADTVLDIQKHESVHGKERRKLTMGDLSRDARKLPRMLAVKYGSKHESDLQRLLLDVTRTEPGTLENRCVDWLDRWIRRHRNNNTEQTTKNLFHLLKTLEEDVIRAQEKEFKQTAVQDKLSVSSRGSSGTITGPQLSHQLKQLKDNVVEEVKGLIHSEILGLKSELRELKQRKRSSGEMEMNVKLEDMGRFKKLTGNEKQFKSDTSQETLYVPMLL